MAKEQRSTPKRGLPEGSSLLVDLGGVTSPRDEEGADLGDFLDEFDVPAQPSRRPTRPAEQEVKPSSTPAPAITKEPEPAAPRVPRRMEQEVTPAAPVVPAAPKQRARPPRKEIGLDPETLGMLDTLHRDAIEQGEEKALSRSEVVRAAVRAAYEARNHVDYSRCGRRGNWGSRTQHALLHALTEAYLKAIGKVSDERV